MRPINFSELNTWPLSCRLRVYGVTILFIFGVFWGLLLTPFRRHFRENSPDL